MKGICLRLGLLAVAVAVTAAFGIRATEPAFAQNTRSWVSGVGDDANPCNRTSPCKTFAGAISKTADNGEINCMDSGAFGAVTLTKAVTIDCAGHFASSLATAATNGVIVNADPTDVVQLRNINIVGAGTGGDGIRFLNGKALHLENVNVFNFSGEGLDVAISTGGQRSLFIYNSTFYDNDAGNVKIAPTSGILNVTVEDSAFVGSAAFGLRAQFAAVAVSNSVSANNVNGGFIALGGSAQLLLDKVQSINNSSGVRADGVGASVTLNASTLAFNNLGMVTDNGGVIISMGNNVNTQNATPGAPTATIGLQ